MFKKFDSYLLTNYPLLWNTKIAWVIFISIIMHILFFIAGFLQLTQETLQNYSSLFAVGGFGLYTFSVLCSLAAAITWLIFYLRNNAFKSFYTIDKFHSAKEFIIIAFTLLLTISFFESYQWGAWLKTRTITSELELENETNVLNQAMAFIPQSKSPYFKLNTCNDYFNNISYDENINYFDSSSALYNDTNYIKIRAALALPDAFSYKNYCYTELNIDEYENFVPATRWSVINNRWLDNKRIDSIEYIIKKLLAVYDKYHISYELSIDSLSRLPFRDSLHTISRFVRPSMDVATSAEYYNFTRYVSHDFVSPYQLREVLDFIEGCYLDSHDNNPWLERFTFELYTAFCLSILLICYRLYKKKVFLISILGTIVWGIIFGLMGTALHGQGLSWFFLFLFAAFIGLALVFLNTKENKTVTGILLNWQIFMFPFLVMMIVGLINDAYYDNVSALEGHYYRTYGHTLIPAEVLKKQFPVGYWVNDHTMLLFRLNILLVFLYTTFVFTRLSKKWHIMPEE